MNKSENEMIMNFLSGTETTKENSQHREPDTPKEKAITLADVADINELVDLYYTGKAVEFPPWVQQTEKGLKIVPQELAIHIIDNYNILSVKLGNSKGITLYLYKDGRYVLWSESEVKAFIKSFLPRKIRRPIDWEYVYKELITESSNTEEQDLNADEDIINFQNCVLRLSTGEMMEHNPKFLSTTQIPVNYNPNLSLSQAPTTLKYLNDVTGGNAEDMTTLLEVVGLVISNVYGWRTKKLLIMKGRGNTGKSVFRELVTFIVGVENTFTVDMEQLHSQFGSAGIYGKRLVGSGDMKVARLPEMDKIKELTGGDMISIEAKYQNRFTIKFYGFLWFNCNQLPYITLGDKGNHVFDRLLIVSCDNVVPEEERDPLLLDKLKAEREYLVCAAVKALNNLIQRDYKFTESERTKQNREDYAMRNNSLALFLKECCEIGIGTTPTKIFKDKYKSWCNDNKFVQEKRSNITQILVEQFGVEKFKSNTDCYRLTIKNT